MTAFAQNLGQSSSASSYISSYFILTNLLIQLLKNQFLLNLFQEEFENLQEKSKTIVEENNRFTI